MGFDIDVLGIIKNKAMVAIMGPCLIATSIFGGVYYLKARSMDKENKQLLTEVTQARQMLLMFDSKLSSLEEQCNQLAEYERNKPKPQLEDEISDTYLNRIFGTKPK